MDSYDELAALTQIAEKLDQLSKTIGASIEAQRRLNEALLQEQRRLWAKISAVEREFKKKADLPFEWPNEI